MDTKLYDSNAVLESEEYNNFVQIILDSFSIATKNVFAIYNVEGKSKWCSCDDLHAPLCKYIHENEQLWKICEKDHIRRTNCDYFKKKNGTIKDHCCFGLWNISYPIYINNKLYCTVITGQKKLSSKEDNDISNYVFYNTVNNLITNGNIDKKTKQHLVNCFNKVENTDSLEESTLGHLANIEKNLLNLLTSIDKQFSRRVKRLTLTRHELHRPNINVKNIALKTKLELENIFKTTQEIDTKTSLSYALLDIEQVINYSKLFSVIIENISSSYTSDMVTINIKRVNILELIKISIDINQSCAENKDVVFDDMVIANLDSKIIEGDEGLLFRMFVNIYQNAVKYSYTGHNSTRQRTVRTEIKEIDGLINVTVTNFGTGITREELESGSIWEEGVRGILSSERHRTGSGLGLPQIRKIAQAHNGSAYIDSEPMSDNITTGPYLTKVIIKLPRLIG